MAPPGTVSIGINEPPNAAGLSARLVHFSMVSWVVLRTGSFAIPTSRPPRLPSLQNPMRGRLVPNLRAAATGVVDAGPPR